MEIAYHAVNLELRPEERALIENELKRIEEWVKNFPTPSYHVEVERSARKGGFGISLHVNLSTRSLFATAWGGDLRTGIETAVDKVERQAKRHLARLREDERAGAETPRTKSFYGEPTVADLEAIRDLEDFKDHIPGHSARLHNYLRRELKLLCQGGKKARVSLPDVVEDTLAYVFERFSEKPKNMSPDRWLMRRGLLFLHDEIDRAQAAASGTEAVPEIVEQHEEWEELMGLVGGDSTPMDARAADAARADPARLRERGRAQTATAEALAGLPDRTRHAIVLRHLEGYQVPEIAYVLNTDETQIRKWLGEAEAVLREKLANWRPA